MANTLYIEWFSEANGRVVIESTEYHLQISPPEWRLSEEDEQQRQGIAGAAWTDFLGKLDAAIQQHEEGAKDPEAPWDEHDYERFLKASDARNEKFGELIDKFGTSDEAQEKIDEAMGWAEELTDAEAEEQHCPIEEINEACEAALNDPEPVPDPAREGIDWIRTADGDIRHPLQDRCFESAIKVSRRCKDLGLKEEEDDTLAEFLFEFDTIGAKLAGALGSVARGYAPPDPAFTVAYLKRGLDHLHKCQAAFEKVANRQSIAEGSPTMPQPLVTEIRRELMEIREGILDLMQQCRGK
jgi:hypothetical protein